MHAKEEGKPMGVTKVIERALDAYRPLDASEAADVQRLRELLAGADVLDRSTPVHVTGSALVVHPPSRRVLLRWHPRMQMWMQVGGHFDAGETDPWLVAVREAREETGLTDLCATAPARAHEPLQIVIVPVPAHGDEPAHEHADFRYLLVTERPNDVVAETAAATLRWNNLEAAIAEAADPNLRVFLSRVSEAVESRDSTTTGGTR
jgi:8-oxo-dGTP pyrophosphatase MutT (NUDIX family)